MELRYHSVGSILNLCAEYNKGEPSGLDPLVSGRPGFPGGPAPSLENALGEAGAASSAALRLLQRQRESDEENLKEECSSTESTHQEVSASPREVQGAWESAPLAVVTRLRSCSQHEDGAGRLELSYLEDEQLRVVSRVDELKSRLTELEQQLQEAKQEVPTLRNPTGDN